MKKILTVGLIILIGLATLCSCGNKDDTASATKPKIVNTKALDDIGYRDTFEVKITKKTIKKDVNPEFSLDGHDSLLLTISNSSETDIDTATIYLVGCDEKNNLVSSFSNLPVYNKSIQSFKTKDTIIKAHESEEFVITCNSSVFSEVKGIVASYTTTDGTEHKNDMVDEWINSAIIVETYELN